MFDLVDIAVFLLISIVFSSQLLSTRDRTSMDRNTPFRINPRGRRRPIIPNRPPQQAPILTSTYEVRPEDIIEVKEILGKTSNLPLELVDMILNCAEYWVCSTTIIHRADPGGLISIFGARQGEKQFLLRTKPLGLSKWSPSSLDLWRVEATPRQLEREYPESDLQKLAEGPLPTLEHPFRKIAFDIESCDQGWSGHHDDYNTYRNSYTWFEAGLERFDMNNECRPDCPDRKNQAHTNGLNIPTCAIRPLWPRVVNDQGGGGGSRYDHDMLAHHDHEIQRNRHAVSELQHHHVEWSWDDNIDPESAEAGRLNEIGRGSGTGTGEFVRNLKFGDMVTVWGHARFPGWENKVKKVEVKVYWTL
ncbi:hypothetical protein F5Y11DRAFT_351843 [Daldinia sp. FL1419]|nr:hypothetical protein F5Y11DRAFT_351843 [Daldinia sp. FL1419]